MGDVLLLELSALAMLAFVAALWTWVVQKLLKRFVDEDDLFLWTPITAFGLFTVLSAYYLTL